MPRPIPIRQSLHPDQQNDLRVSELSQRVSQLERRNTLQAEEWHYVGNAGEPAFQNSWVNWGGSYAPARFKLLPGGLVIVDGFIKLGSIGSPAFTLPIGYRPLYILPVGTMGNNAFAVTEVQPDGDVVPNVGSNAFFSLSSIRFIAEQ